MKPVIVPEKTDRLPAEPVSFKSNPDLCKRWCRWVWWHKYYPLGKIIELTGVPELLLRRWIRGRNSKDPDGWAYQRSKVAEMSIKAAVANEGERLDETLYKLLNVLESYVDKVLEEGLDLTVDEFNNLTSSFDKLFKARQLVMGKPTEIGDRKITWEVVMKKLKEVDIIEYDGQRTSISKLGSGEA